MTLLTVWREDAPDTPELRTEDAAEIAVVLKELGVRFEQWPVQELPDRPTQDDVLDAYRDRIDGVTAAEGYTLVDVVQMHPSDDPSWPETVRTARAKFLDEHTHDDDEDRFFATGSGIFYLRLQGKVHAVLCEAGDLLSVPGGTTHWFDMGTSPDYVSVRFFHDDEGWVGSFTDSGISRGFSTYDQIVAAR
ncbi:1,2-dihydroxy-3-keto-5-methylthiopentene dioxygenase [Trujillonella endophytica]|uniref:Acireductone dioxygenase n=1 Tax=Trujillonella endophytica TaxID=673521 RepID=A0A1H8WNF8_9ACTN|nr:cupin [Trujillella endophytica]SEP29152.1 1,2-dihydroxy-3-keto-5-methylthiopentene dioxygenase [Trujillella endophytica]